MIPIRVNPEAGLESCAICDADTDHWTDLPRRREEGQVACCPRCAERHCPWEVPTKTAWCNRPHFRDGRPRRVYGPLAAALRLAEDFNARAAAAGRQHVQYTTVVDPDRTLGSWVSGRAFVSHRYVVMVPLEHEDAAVPLDRLQIVYPQQRAA